MFCNIHSNSHERVAKAGTEHEKVTFELGWWGIFGFAQKRRVACLEMNDAADIIMLITRRKLNASY